MLRKCAQIVCAFASVLENKIVLVCVRLRAPKIVHKMLRNHPQNAQKTCHFMTAFRSAIRHYIREIYAFYSHLAILCVVKHHWDEVITAQNIGGAVP